MQTDPHTPQALLVDARPVNRVASAGGFVPQLLGLEIRGALSRDLAWICLTEQYAFPYPWSVQQVTEAARYCRNLVSIATVHGERAGYLFLGLDARRIQVLNLAVDERFRRLGVGAALLRFALSLMSEEQPVLVSLVSEANLPAQRLMRHCGLRATRLVRSPFVECDQDGIVFGATYDRRWPRDCAT